MINLVVENNKRLKTCYKLGKSAKIEKVKNLGFNLVNTASAQICFGLEGLEEEFQKGNTVKNVNIEGNDKLGEIPAISFPNIFIQSTFMQIVKKNPWIREKYQSVDILMEYFENNKVCLNCEECNGMCYNNSDIYFRPNKALSDLRTLLAYITNPNGLRKKICRTVRFRTVFRINANGEIHSKEMLMFWLSIANEMKRTTFFTYTKSYELFEEYLKENKLPKNFIVNMSMIEGSKKDYTKYENLYKGNKFKVVTSLPKKCKNVCAGDCTECNLCYTNQRKNNNTIYVLYHNSGIKK